METADVVIIGARCAGSPLATFLARRGLRVVVLDKARFPSDTPSTHVIQPAGVGVLERLGVLDEILAAGAVPLEHLTLVNEDARIEGTLGSPGLCVRRTVLDALLAAGASAAGAQVRTATKVTGLLRDRDGRVTGVQTENGAVNAALIVGADGRHSTVAREVGAAEYDVAAPGRLFAWAYFEGVDEPDARLRIGRCGDLTFAAAPTDSDLYLAAVCPPLSATRHFLDDRDAGYARALTAWPELADLLAGATRSGPVRAVSEWHGYLREATGPGWVLLGDAGHFKDPSPAQGISDALRHAAELAPVIAAGVEPGVEAGDLDRRLRDWWSWRDDDITEMHWFAADMGAAGASSALVTQFMRDIAADQTATDTLLDVLNHDARPSQLFTAARLGRAAVRVARHQPAQIPAMTKEAVTTVRTEIRRARQQRRQPSRQAPTRRGG